MAKKILVIDDNEGILEAIEFVLEEYDYEVKTLRDANLVYPIVQEFNPDVILLDILISGLDGRTICREFKKKEEYRGIPVIILSAHPTAKDELETYGAQEFLAKPFEVIDLIDAIDRHTS